MKVLCITNYFYIFGGAERVFFNTRELLNKNGHELIDFAMNDKKNLDSKYSKYFASHVDFTDRNSALKNFSRAPSVIYNKNAKEKLSKLIKDESPDIAFVHNIGRRLSNSIFYALFENKIPVVHMLHDYKPICSINSFFRDENICQECLKHQFYKASVHCCNHHSLSASLVDSYEKYFHWKKRTYDKINLFISPSKFLKNKMIEGGLKETKIEVLPHFIESEKIKPNYFHSDYIMSFSRLDDGKGIETLIDAVKELKNVKLKIAGDGPLKNDLIKRAKNCANIEFTGRLEQKRLEQLIANAMFVVVPSEWFEVFGMVSVEAMSFGKTVVGSDMGGTPEIIEDGKTGLLFKSGKKDDLKSKIAYLFNKPELAITMGKNARETIENEFSSKNYYKDLIDIFNKVLEG